MACDRLYHVRGRRVPRESFWQCGDLALVAPLAAVAAGEDVRYMPELMVLIKGMVSASRVVFFTMFLLLICIYVFAIVFRQLTDDTEAGHMYFSSILGSMYTLFLHGALLDELGDMCTHLAASDPAVFVVFLIFICIAALLLMNMLVGVLCEVVSAVAARDKEERVVHFVKTSVGNLLKEMDMDSNNKISKEEFTHILENKRACATLMEVGVDPVGLVDFTDFIFDDGDGNEIELSFNEFIEVVLDKRKDRVAKVKDIMNVTSILRQDMKKLKERVTMQRPRRASVRIF